MSTRAHTVSRFYLDYFASEEGALNSQPALWVCQLESGSMKRRGAKNMSIERGLYDGPGCLGPGNGTIEAHLARIESNAASAIRAWVSLPQGARSDPPRGICRFLAWQATRTLPMKELFGRWFDALVPTLAEDVASRAEVASARFTMESRRGERVEARVEDLAGLHREGWQIVLSNEQFQQVMHLQAWFLETKHFAKMSWGILDAPRGHPFVTSDRPVAWTTADLGGLAPPGLLGDRSAVVIAPLTSAVAMLGYHGSGARFETTSPRDVNRLVANLADKWIAGPSRLVVEQAYRDTWHRLPSTQR